MADARSAAGWHLALLGAELPEGGGSKVMMADCLPLLKDLAVPGVRGVFGYPFVEKTIKELKKALIEAQE